MYLCRKNAGRWEIILDITNRTEPFYEESVSGELAEEELTEEDSLQQFPDTLLEESLDQTGLAPDEIYR